MAQLLLGWTGLPTKVRRAEPDRTEFARVAEPIDNLIRVTFGGKKHRRGWILFEALASWKTGYEKTVRHHWENSRRAGKTALPVVLVLKKGHGRTTMEPWEVVESKAFGAVVEAFRFVVIKLWEVPSSEAVARGPLIALPLLPLTRDASEDMVHAGFSRLWKSKDARRDALVMTLAINSSQVFPARDWLARIPLETQMKWPALEQIMTRGKRELVAELLRDRFDARTAASLVARLELAVERKITRASKLIASTQDDDALLAALRKLLPPPRRKQNAR